MRLAPELVGRAAHLADGGRAILGIVGAPGSGKSTVAEALVSALGAQRAVAVPLDGFHLADEELRRLGRADRKGAVDTFDGYGYLALLRRLRAADDPVVYAPLFDRHRETAVAGAIPVPVTVPLVITEGNWLLDGTEPWRSVRDLFTETWFVEIDEELRLQRLVRRHVEYGKGQVEAQEWAAGPDQRNAERILAAASTADLRLRLDR
jgi:pantothenate kinase